MDAIAFAQGELMGLFDKLKRGLAKTKQVLQTDVRDLFKAGEILDEQKLQRSVGNHDWQFVWRPGTIAALNAGAPGAPVPWSCLDNDRPIAKRG